MKLILPETPRYSRELLGILVFVIVISLMELVGWLGIIKPVVERVGLPLSQIHARVIGSVASSANYFGQAVLRTEQVRELERGYAIALAQLSELEQLRQENQILREMLENTDRTLETKRITAPIVSLSVPAISAGEQEGVVSGSMVGARGILLGRVKEVSMHQSTVELFSGPASAPVLVKTESGVQGLVQGNGQQVILTQIPREEAIAGGQRVITLGQPGISSGLLVGTVGEIITRDSAPVQSAVVNQPVSFYEVSIVEVW